MRTKQIELDVDFIGGQGSLTTEEEKALSAFFKQRKTMVKAKKSTEEISHPKTTA